MLSAFAPVHDNKQLRAEHALLPLWRPGESQIVFMTGLRALALGTLAVSLAVDWGIHDAQHGPASWLIYGTSAAQLNMVPYYVLALRLSMSKTLHFSDMSLTAQPLTGLGAAVWCAYASGTVCLCAAFMVYEMSMKAPGRRDSEEPVLGLNFGFCLANALLGNTPLLPRQVVAPLVSVALYFIGLAVYEIAAGLQIYPVPLGVFALETLFSVAFCFAVLWGALELRERCAPSHVWMAV